MTDTTVYSSPTFIGGEMVGGGSTHNLGLLQKRMMLLHTGLGLVVAGALFLSGRPAEIYQKHTLSADSEEGKVVIEESEGERGFRLRAANKADIVGAILVGLFLLVLAVGLLL